MWVFLTLLALGGAGLWLGGRRNNLRQAWTDAVKSCGLEVVEGSSWTPLVARAGSVVVRMEPGRNKGQSTRISIEAPGPPEFRGVRILPESFLSRGREIEVGDESFDSAFFIEGPAPLVLALLDAEMRRLLSLASKGSRLEISMGVIGAEMIDRKIPSVLPLLLEIGQRLARPLDIPQLLAENAKGDPKPGVRLQNLLFLIRRPRGPEIAKVLRAASMDPSPEIRLRAAKELGAEGREVLVELAESLVDDTVSAEAVTALGGELPFERAKALLDQALSPRRFRTALACLEAIGKSGAAAAVGALEKVMAEDEGRLAAAAARILGTIGNPAAEPALIQAFEKGRIDLQVAAANALSRVGSAAAVLPLKKVAERSWLELDLELRRAARQAVAEIQSRLQGASPGQLSLAGAESGQLSLAEAEAGRLSIATDPAGQVSLSESEEERKRSE